MATRSMGENERGEWPADNFLIRGTRFNRGVLLKFMMDAGADIIGDPPSHTAWPLMPERHYMTAGFAPAWTASRSV